MPILGKQEPDKQVDYVALLRWHGVQLLAPRNGSNQAVGLCPWCGKEGKFYLNTATSQWDCKSCGEAGNSSSFLLKLWEESKASTRVADLVELAEERKLFNHTTLSKWGVVRSFLTDEWLLPGYSHTGSLRQLYRYTVVDGRMRLLATPGLPLTLYGIPLFKPEEQVTWICEGPWDAMALWEVTRHLGKTAFNVLAVPSCSTWQGRWGQYAAGRNIVLAYDNDHPRPHPKTGKLIPPAGLAGMQRVAGLLRQSSTPPASIHYLKWGNEGDGWNPNLPTGYDVRDHLTRHLKVRERLQAVAELTTWLAPLPAEWAQQATTNAGKPAANQIQLLPCSTYRDLELAWRKALRWLPGLGRALTCMLATVVSTRTVTDQLWLKVVGPAACGKSTLCEALATNKEWIVAKSTIRGFHSGFQVPGGQDSSLLAQLRDKTLVTKDGDTLLQSPNLKQILAEARDIYDSVSRTHYRNRTSRDYEGLRVTWILCGTSSLRSLDSSELGERFLDCVIMDDIDPDLEDEILWRKINATDAAVSGLANGKVADQYEPAKLAAMQLTGGYIDYLAANANQLLAAVQMPVVAKQQCMDYSKFIAYMRSRPSVHQEEEAQRELGSRLSGQLVKLAKCVAVVWNKPTTDAAVMGLVKQVTLDTARGRTLRLVQQLANAGPAGLPARALALSLGTSEVEELKLLKHLRGIGVVESYLPPGTGRATTSRLQWRLLPRMLALYDRIMGG